MTTAAELICTQCSDDVNQHWLPLLVKPHVILEYQDQRIFPIVTAVTSYRGCFACLPCRYSHCHELLPQLDV
eukprot:COSAG02_NODE_4623_length_5153_cov_3.148793_3_plen_72_part_00